MKKSTIWLLVVLAVVVLGGGIYVLVKNKASADVVANLSSSTASSIGEIGSVSYNVLVTGTIIKGIPVGQGYGSTMSISSTYSGQKQNLNVGFTTPSALYVSDINPAIPESGEQIGIPGGPQDAGYIKKYGLLPGRKITFSGTLYYNGKHQPIYLFADRAYYYKSASGASPTPTVTASLVTTGWVHYPKAVIWNSGPRPDVIGTQTWTIDGETASKPATFSAVTTAGGDSSSQCLKFERIKPGEWHVTAIQTCYVDLTVKMGSKVWTTPAVTELLPQ